MSNSPATPPRSRYSNIEEDTEIIKRDSIFPSTPNKNNLSNNGPVTPSTVHKNIRNNKLIFKNGPFLQPPNLQQQNSTNTNINSPFNGLKSPEFTPLRRSSITSTNTSTSTAAVNRNGLNSVSRVLFPQDTDEPARKKLNIPNILLPPSTPKKIIQEEQQFNTPNDKITDFKLSKEWHNKDYIDTDSDDNDNDNTNNIISNEPITNPFMSNDIPSKEQRVLRKMQLLQEDPNIDKYITYINKKGEIVKQRRLSNKSQQLKPKMLFEDQLYSEDKSDLE